ncbi:MAG: translation initiation factor IF-3 [Chlamydiales bacterium]
MKKFGSKRPTGPRQRINRDIRAPKVRVIGPEGDQLGVMTSRDAQFKAQNLGLDLVEISPNANPPVCKILDYGKFKYEQTKKDRESKKSQHQIKIKEIKVKPNIDTHDLEVKLKRARDFIEKGNKVKVTCMFRGREMAHKDVGKRVVDKVCEELSDIADTEAHAKQMGRNLSLTLAPKRK